MAEAQRRSRVDGNVSSLSKKLLEGWTLLSESCPNPECNVPLVKNRAGTETFCVSCESFIGNGPTGPYLKPKEGEGGPLSPLAPPAAGAGGGGRFVVGEAEAMDFEDAQSRTISHHLAEEAASDDIKRQRVDGGPGAVGGDGTPEACSAKLAAARARSDRSSSKIAEKLLSGWTLLQDYCPMPECNTPLVRSRDKKLFCVGCEMMVVTEAEYQRHAKQDAAPAQPPTPPAMGDASPLPSPAAAPALAPPPAAAGGGLVGGAGAPAGGHPLAAAAASARGGGGRPRGGEGAAAAFGIAAGVEGAAHALTAKMREAQAALASCQDVAGSRDLVALISECARGLADLHALM